jgi:hypothetical protein
MTLRSSVVRGLFLVGIVGFGLSSCGSATLRSGDGGAGQSGASGVAGTRGSAGAGGAAGTSATGGVGTAGAAGGAAGSRTATIAITGPTSPTYTNKVLTVTVSVTASGASSIELLKNGTMLSALAGPPYSFNWDTTKEVEGSYQLVAQMVAGGQIVASAPVTVVVDRTPPTIVSMNPATAATNVSLTDPIQAVFSEALAPATITASSVTLALGSTAVGATATLGADGKTVTVGITNLATLVLPGTMTESATAAITDLAGNAFSGASWNFSVPLWVDLGSVSGVKPEMVLDSSGVPIVATIVTAGSASQLQIAKHTTGTSWDTSTPSPQVQTTVTEFSLAIDKSNALFVAWDEGYASGTATPILVARWTGTAWDKSYGQLLHTAGGEAERPAIAVTSSGQPIARWVELVALGSGPGYVSRWTGTAWNSFAGVPSGDCDIQPCRIVLDSSDAPVIELGDEISRWTGSSWTPLVSGGDGLAINSSQQVITFQDTATSIQVLSISTAGAAANYVPALSVTSIESEPVRLGQVAVDGSDEPIVVWFQYDGGTPSSPTNPTLHVARWTGAAWDQGYGTLSNASGQSSLVLAQGTTPIVAWADSATATVHVNKSNH